MCCFCFNQVFAQIVGEQCGIEGLEYDPVEEFSNWLGRKVGGNNEHLRSFTMIISTFAVLEFAQYVLNVGSGFTKMDLSGITLTQIKETVQRIEGKVDRMLEAPLKNAKMHCDSAITRISHKRMEDAYNLFDKVINEATNAYNLLDQKDISMDDFQGCIQAIQLLIFAEIARISYDKKKECFLPISLLKKEDISLIGQVLSKHVTGCISKMDNVNTSAWYSKKKELQKKSKVQNIVDC